MSRSTVATRNRRLSCIVLALAVPLLGGQSAPPSLASLDRAFACPETLPSDEARMTSLRGFFDDYARVKPGATPPEIIEYRRLLLEKHRCREALAHLAAADRAVAGGADPLAQAWVPVARHNGVALAMSASRLTTVIDPRFSSERTVEAYARATFAAPMLTSATQVRYDELVSRTVYFCRSGRYALIENVFFLAGRQVLTDAGEVVGHTNAGAPLYRIVDTPAGSLNAEAAAWACSTARATAS